MSLAIEISNFVSDLMDRASGTVHVASYTMQDTATYVLSDDQTHVRLIVHHAEKRSQDGATVNTIAPTLVKMLTEGSTEQSIERSIEESMREQDEKSKRINEVYDLWNKKYNTTK